MRNARIVLCVPIVCACASGCAGPGKVVSTQSLLNEMTDLRGLTEFPDPPFTCKQFSSYDRKSKSPTEDWFANADCGKYLRIEERDGRSEHVMMDVDGPGAIVRIWSANPKGTLRIYLDGADVPVIEAPMAEFLGGDAAGVPKPIAGARSKGWNSYFPIPYAKHCKVTSDEGGSYYHVNYRTYLAGTQVVSLDPGQLNALSEQIVEVAGQLASARAVATLPWLPDGDDTPPARVVLQPGDVHEMECSGQGWAVWKFEAAVEAGDRNAALRQLWLTMEFDGEETVACPLGDFFGAAPGVNPYESLPMGVTEDGVMWSHWVMPFYERAVTRFRNMGDHPVTIVPRIVYVGYPWTDRSMHFCAKWRTEFDVPTRPMVDWNYLAARGTGVFVGAAFAITNPTKHWWGEGDEKIYVDGETFPSHFGTGTEDYYGYAWCSNEPFTHAYHNQPRCDGPGNYGHTAVNRWHVLDRIPFERDFRFDMELWHWATETKVTMSVVSYWYARPGGADEFAPVEAADLRLELLPPYVAPKVAGAIEGEEMRIIEKTAAVGPQLIDGCSSEAHMWWHHGVKMGDRLVLGFQVPETGRYRILARFVKAKDYGVASLSINGAAAGEPIDLYNNGIIVTEEIDLGVFDLKAGENQIAAEIVGANEKAVKSYLFGLDYVRLVRGE